MSLDNINAPSISIKALFENLMLLSFHMVGVKECNKSHIEKALESRDFLRAYEIFLGLLPTKEEKHDASDVIYCFIGQFLDIYDDFIKKTNGKLHESNISS